MPVEHANVQEVPAVEAEQDQASYYQQAEWYEIAFGTRDVEPDCDFLVAACEAYGGARPRSFLEIFAGPGAHAVALAKRGIRCAAVDYSGPMLDLCQRRARENGVTITPIVDDARSFRTNERFDLAATVLLSAHHLLSNEDFLLHLECVARHLEPRGIYILEMDHPVSQFGLRQTYDLHWTERRGDVKVTTTWGDHTDTFDPITQIDEVATLTVVERPGHAPVRMERRLRSRRYTYQMLLALFELCPHFELVGSRGALRMDVPLDNGPKTNRAVCILRRT